MQRSVSVAKLKSRGDKGSHFLDPIPQPDPLGFACLGSHFSITALVGVADEYSYQLIDSFHVQDLQNVVMGHWFIDFAKAFNTNLCGFFSHLFSFLML